MSLAIDAVILLGVILIVWRAAVTGFVRSLMSLAGSVASFFAAYAYSPMLAEHIKEKFLLSSMTDGIEGTLRSIALDVNTDKYNLDKLASDLPKAFTDILERYNIGINEFSQKFAGLTSCDADVVRGFAEDIATPTANVIAYALAFIVLFVGVLIIISILTGLIDLIFKLPVLNTANTVLGVVFGIAEGVVFAFIAAMALSSLVTALGAIDPTLFGEAAVNQSIICKFLVAHNPLETIIKVIFN